MLRLRSIVVLVLAFLIACSGESKHPVAVLRQFPNAPVILISIDTLRADHLPIYGYRKVETPAIDALAKDGILFESAWSHCPMTLPSHISILTGLLPQQHGVRNNLGFDYDPLRHPAVSMLLKQRGYATGAAVSAYVLRGSTGLAKAFDFYDDAVPTRTNASVGELSRPGGATVRVAEPWIAKNSSRPFFFLLHLFEPHSPYEPPEPFKSRYASAYDGEIATADSIVALFIDFLKKSGIYDRALIILLADHGEGLGDHGEQEHGLFLYREVIRVPLLIKLPHAQRAGATVSAPVQLADIAPTILRLTGTGVPPSMKGASILDVPRQPRRIYSESLFARIHFGWSELRSLVDAGHQYIEAPRPELYDIIADPGEKVNVLSKERRTYAELRDAMAPFRDSAVKPANISAEEAAKLAALGYVGSVRSSVPQGPLADPKDHVADLERMQAAAGLESSRDYPRALEIYRSLVRDNPRFTDAWLKLAIVYENLGDLRAAVECDRKAIEAAPELAPGIAVSIANLQLRLGDVKDAEAHARLALKRSPGAAHIVLARVALRRHDIATAENEARAAMDDKVRARDAAVVLAQVLTAAGRLHDALALLDDVARDAIAAENLQATRGDILSRMGRGAEAERAFREEIRTFPQNLDAWSKLAVLYVTEGRLAAARTAIETMVRLNPGPRSRRVAAATFEAVELPREAARWR